MDIEIIAVSRYGCSRRLLGGRRIVSAVARRMEIKLALFVRSPSVPTCHPSLLPFAYISENDHAEEIKFKIVESREFSPLFFTCSIELKRDR